MDRNLELYKKWEDHHRTASLKEFEQSKAKEISDAQNVIDNATNEFELKSGNGMMRVAIKMKFYFEKKWLLQYGTCTKFNKQVSFLPVTCQIETQHCFSHRKDNSHERG